MRLTQFHFHTLKKCPKSKPIKSLQGYGREYSFSFNGKEMDNETYGTGNEYDYGLRIYSTRLGRFLSTDPLSKNFPWNSTYAYAENRVIDGIDLEGGEFMHYSVAGVNNKNQPAVQLADVTHSNWVSSALHTMAGINIEPTKIFVLQYEGKGYMFSSFKEMITKDVSLLDPKTTSTYENLQGLFKFTDAAGAAVVSGIGSVKVAEAPTTPTFERVMATEELVATETSGLLRGGRTGRNHFTTTASTDAKRAQQRLGLDGALRDVKVNFTITSETKVLGPVKAKPGVSGTSGGGAEFWTDDITKVQINKVTPLKK